MANELKQMERQDVESTERVRARPVFRPRTDIYETNDSGIMLAEMTGVAPDAVDVTLERRLLTISGKGPDDTHAGYRQNSDQYVNTPRTYTRRRRKKCTRQCTTRL